MKINIHPLADVQSKKIGLGTQIWQYSVILEEAEIGENCNINCHTFIENDVFIGNNVTIKCGVFLWDGIRIMDNAFIGPNVTFVNDKYPRSKKYPEKFQQTIVGQFASIGAGAIILGGVIIEDFALIAAGSVVTKNIPKYALVKGNPARVCGRLNSIGEIVERF